MPDSRDPVAEGWVPGAPVGLRGIELHTRRRNRLNGTLVRTNNGAVGVAVGQSYRTCPQYINARQLATLPHPPPASQGDTASVPDRAGEARNERTSAEWRQ